MYHCHTHGSVAWHDGGLAPPKPQIILEIMQPGPEQWDLWKLPAATDVTAT